jgi:hypothetical protein
MAKKKERTLTMRLDGLLDERISSKARARGVSRADIVRDALEREFLHAERVRTMTAYERLKPYIGVIDSSKSPGGPFTSEDATGQYQKGIDEKYRRRRAQRPR